MSDEIKIEDLKDTKDQDAAPAAAKENQKAEAVKTDTNEKLKDKGKSKKKIAKKGPYRTTTPFFILGLLSCIPVVGLVILLYLRNKAEDLELKSVCEALVFLRPIVIVLTLLIYTFIIILAVKVSGLL